MKMDTVNNVKECDTCKRSWPLDRFRSDNPAPGTCFKCRSAGISLTLQGGKEYWTSDTEKRRSDRALAEARKAGFDPVPAESGKSFGGVAASTLSKIGAVSASNGAFGKKPNIPVNSSAGTPARKA